MSQDRHKRTCCCWRESSKIEMQEPPKIIPEELSYKQALEMHMHGSQGHKARIYIENAAEQMEHPVRAAQLVRACALEIYMDI